MTNLNLPAALGGRLQQLRKQRGLSQEELAGHLGVSRQAVSKWECGQAQPELTQVLALSDFFAVSCDFLLKGDLKGDLKGELKGIAAPPETEAKAEPSQSAAAPAKAKKPGPFLINAILWAWLGLFLSWGLWDYWQYSWCALLGLGCSALSGAVLAMGLAGLPTEEQQQTLGRFWLWSVWPLSQMGLAIIYTGIASRGIMLAPIISPVYLGNSFPGLFFLAWLAWAAICGFVCWKYRPGRA